MPKVSIILTSYNHEAFIQEAIDSVLGQSYSDFELIIIDDASVDGSWEIIKSYSDPRMKIFRNDENLGTVTVLNNAVSNLTDGEYIAIHHSDDYWHKEKLEKQVGYLETHADVGAVFTSVEVVSASGEKFNNKNHFYYSIFDQKNRSRHEWLRHFFFHGNCLCHPSLLVRRECYKEIGLYDLRLCQLPDFDMWIRIAFKYNIFVMQEKLTYFRVTGEETSESGNRKETRIRSSIELNEVMRNYNKIDNVDEMLNIFPEAEKYIREDGVAIDFVLAMIALGENTSNWVKNLGLDILFHKLSTPSAARNIESAYGFNYRDFIEMTGENDIYHVEKTHVLEVALNDCVNIQKAAIAERDEALRKKNAAESELDLIYNSSSWKLTSPLRKIFSLFK